VALDTTTNKQVAIKAINRRSLVTAEARGQLRREIAALASIKHRNIVAFRECYEDNNHVYIVTEVCGQELYDHIVDNGFISEAKSKRLCRQMLHAVEHLHKNGFVHRDIKPENFCLGNIESGTSESDLNVKLIDFGLCCQHRGQVMQNRCGSYFYVAPEVLHKSYSGGTCDVWSVGVVLFVMLVGYPPFYGETDDEIAAQVKNAEPDLTLERWHGISKEAKDLVLRLLVKDPAKRLTAAQALRDPWLCEAKPTATTRLTIPTLLECTKRRRSRSLELSTMNRSLTDQSDSSLSLQRGSTSGADPAANPRLHAQTYDAEDLQALQSSMKDFHLQVEGADPASMPLSSGTHTPAPPKQPRAERQTKRNAIFRRSFRRKTRNSVACAP